MAKLKDVAEAAGVSTATVSRVLSGAPHVRPEVRDRVLAAVDRLGYRPNLLARGLRAHQSTMIGLVVPDVANPFFTAITRAVEDEAYAHGYSVFLCNSDEDPEKESTYLHLMGDEGAAGVIIAPTRAGSASLAAGLPFPAIVIDRTVTTGDFDAVLIDNVDAGNRLTGHLIDNGYRHIALIADDNGTTGRERHAGYEKALRAAAIPLAAEYVKMAPSNREAGHAAALRLLDLPTPPDALIATSSLLATGALEAIRARNLRIPLDVALAGFDETTWTRLVEPALTVIAQPAAEIGQTAADLLFQRIADPDRATRQVILKGRLVARGSSARRD